MARRASKPSRRPPPDSEGPFVLPFAFLSRPGVSPGSPLASESAKQRHALTREMCLRHTSGADRVIMFVALGSISGLAPRELVAMVLHKCFWTGMMIIACGAVWRKGGQRWIFARMKPGQIVYSIFWWGVTWRHRPISGYETRQRPSGGLLKGVHWFHLGEMRGE